MCSAKEVQSWSTDQVADWLRRYQFDQYVDLLTRQHKIDGLALLMLSERDLKEPPLSIAVLGDVKRLTFLIDKLRLRSASQVVANGDLNDATSSSHHLLYGSLLHDDLPVDGDGIDDRLRAECLTPQLDDKHPHGVVSRVTSSSTVSTTLRRNVTSSDFIIDSVERRVKSFWKTLLAFLYCQSSLLLTAVVMVIVHDRVPDMKLYPPLPDLFLDKIALIPWAFEMCEVIALLLSLVWTLVLFFHRHRMILFRRMCSLVGTVFILRCITMLITSLSVPGVHLECNSNNYGTWTQRFRVAFKIYAGMGMSLRGVRSCGDYMFSGHTVAITLLNHFITEYTPEHWYFLHTATWVMNLFGIFFILAGHEHYSIDVFVAFYISSRLFLYYHSLAYNVLALTRGDARTRIWFPLFWFFESGGAVGRLRNEYEWPLPSVQQLSDWLSGWTTVARKHTNYCLTILEKRRTETLEKQRQDVAPAAVAAAEDERSQNDDSNSKQRKKSKKNKYYN